MELRSVRATLRASIAGPGRNPPMRRKPRCSYAGFRRPC